VQNKKNRSAPGPSHDGTIKYDGPILKMDSMGIHETGLHPREKGDCFKTSNIAAQEISPVVPSPQEHTNLCVDAIEGSVGCLLTFPFHNTANNMNIKGGQLTQKTSSCGRAKRTKTRRLSQHTGSSDATQNEKMQIKPWGGRSR
jgi:hypothetical protein